MSMISLAWISMSVAWPWKPELTWWMRIFAFGQRHALALGAARQQQRAHRHRDADADRLHVGLDELHRVVDREARVHRPARRVDVQRDVLVRVLGLEVQQLGDDQVRDLVVHGCPQEDDALVQQPAVDVEGALASRRLLDHHGDKGAHGPRSVSLVDPDSCRRSANGVGDGSKEPTNRLFPELSGVWTPRVTGAGSLRTGGPDRLFDPPRVLLVGGPQLVARARLLRPSGARAFSASRSTAWRWARSSLSSSRRPAFSSRSRSFSGVVPSRAAEAWSASSTSPSDGSMLLRLDRRRRSRPRGAAPARRPAAPRRGSRPRSCRRSAGSSRA